MKRLAGLGLLTLALAVPAADATTAVSHAAPQVLTSFANIGTVYWRCERHGWSLGFRGYSNSADAYLRVRTGRASTHLQPRKRTWFPSNAAKTQELTASRAIHPNTATVRGTGDLHACLPSDPPAAH